jgi:hypothetical protein
MIAHGNGSYAKILFADFAWYLFKLEFPRVLLLSYVPYNIMRYIILIYGTLEYSTYYLSRLWCIRINYFTLE